MTELQKALIIPLALVILIPASILLYFAENIKGYYRFKWYCENEGGLKVYEKLEKNVGWMAEDKFSAMAASHLKSVKLVRYPEKKEKGKLYDLFYKGGNPSSFKSHEITPANLYLQPKYRWQSKIGRIPGELRLTELKYEISNLKNNQTLIIFKRFSYSLFEQSKTLLAAPSGESCHSIGKIFKYRNLIFIKQGEF
jgi:hypothetical protein